MTSELGSICTYSKNKCLTSSLSNKTYVSTENMLPNRGGITDSSGLPDQAQVSSFARGEILVSNIRPYFKKIWKAQFSGGCSNDVLVFKANPGIDPDYLYYVLSDDRFFEYSTSTSNGTKMPRGDKKAILKYPVMVPSIEKQKKIALILSAIDGKIRLNNRINGCLEAQAESIYNSFVRRVDESWKIGTLEEIATSIICGKTPSTRDASNYGSDVPFVTIPDLHGQVFITGTERSLSLKGASSQSNKYLPPFTVVVSCIGTAGLVSMTSEKSQTNQQINSIIPKNGVSPFYCYFVAKQKKEEINAVGMSGSTIVNLNKQAFSRLETIIPNQQLMMEFDRAVRPFFQAILYNQKQNRLLAIGRDSLLPKLMSGEIDVDDIEV